MTKRRLSYPGPHDEVLVAPLGVTVERGTAVFVDDDRVAVQLARQGWTPDGWDPDDVELDEPATTGAGDTSGRAEPDTFPHPVGNGWWRLSDGSKFPGTEAEAQAAEVQLAGMPENANPRIEWVGTDPARARAALDDETSRGDKARSSVVDHARQVLQATDAGDTGQDNDDQEGDR